MPRMSTPPLVWKRLSSIEITASLTIRGICQGVTITRLCWLTNPERMPEVVVAAVELCSFLYCENRVSDGRSEATATNMPNTNDTSPSSSTAKRIATNRSLFRRGLGAGGVSGRSSSLISSRGADPSTTAPLHPVRWRRMTTQRQRGGTHRRARV